MSTNNPAQPLLDEFSGWKAVIFQQGQLAVEKSDGSGVSTAVIGTMDGMSLAAATLMLVGRLDQLITILKGA